MAAIASCAAARIALSVARLLRCYMQALPHDFLALSQPRRFHRKRPISGPQLLSHSLLRSPATSPDPRSTPGASTFP